MLNLTWHMARAAMPYRESERERERKRERARERERERERENVVQLRLCISFK